MASSLMASYFIVQHHGVQAGSPGAPEPQGTIFTIRLAVNPNQPPPGEGNQDLLQKVLANEAVWEKLLTAQ